MAGVAAAVAGATQGPDSRQALNVALGATANSARERATVVALCNEHGAEDLDGLVFDALHLCGRARRSDALVAIGRLAPAVETLGGAAAVAGVAEEILRVSRKFP